MLTEQQKLWLAQRFPHFQPTAGDMLAHAEQPESSTDGGFPAIRLVNDVWWYPVKAARPMREGRVLKTRAPAGKRRPIVLGVPDAKTLLLVEGEGDGLAVYSVDPSRTVVVAGGTNNLLADDLEQERRELFAGREVVLLFDGDDPGQKGAVALAELLLALEGTTVKLGKVPGEDVEQFLAEQPTSGEAANALRGITGGAEKLGKRKLASMKKDVDRSKAVQSERVRVQGDTLPRLVVMTYQRAGATVGLAVHGPEQKEAVPGYGDVPTVGERRWQTCERWQCNGETYLPDASDATLEYLQRGTLILPPPPVTEELASEELWRRMRTYMQKWVQLTPDAYNVLVAYALMTWRLEDAGFSHVPYLRFYGPSGSGKGRALTVMRQLVWRAFATKPSMQNLHRVVDYLGDVTLLIDEFHLDEARSNAAQRELVDALCLGYERAQGNVARVEDRNGTKVIKIFKLFGAKVFAGYGHDEDEGLARRTVAVAMEPDAELPEDMDLVELPEAFHQEGEELRGHLLSWRGRKLAMGMPDATASAIRTLQKRAGRKVAQVFFPLVAMVPEGLPEELESILRYAEARGTDVEQARAHSSVAFILQSLLHCLAGARRVTSKGDRVTTWYVTPSEIASASDDLTSEAVAGRLRAAGLKTERRRMGDAAQRYYRLREDDPELVQLFERHGLTWPEVPADPSEDQEDKKEAGL